MQHQDHNHLDATFPGIDLEPLEPFCDDVFGGMDEHPAGPWGGLDPPELLHHQHHHNNNELEDSHFPAIACNLLDHQPHTDGAAAASYAHEAGHASAEGDQLLAARASATQLPAPPPGLDVLEGMSLDDSHSQLQSGMGAECSLAAAAADPGNNSQLPQSPKSDAGCRQGETACASSSSSSSSPPRAQPGSDSTLLAAAAGEGAGFLVAEECVAIASGSASPTCPSHERAATPDTALAAAAESAAALEAEASSASLPDIDDVAEEQLGLPVATQQQQQQEEEEEEENRQQAQEEQEQPHHHQQQQQEEAAPALHISRAQAEDCGPSDMKGSSSAHYHTQAHAAADAQAQAATLAAPAAEDATAADLSTGSSSSAVAPASAAAGAAGQGSADVGGGSTAAGIGSDQQLSVDAEDFASPCSSWHSCVTAASKLSSMTSSRGFFVPAETASNNACKQPSSQQTADDQGQQAESKQQSQEQQQQSSSRSGSSTPAMVSSLHLALQQQQQQQQSHHSDQVSASAASTDPLTSAGVDAGSLPDDTAPGAQDPSGTAPAGGPEQQQQHGSASQPIAMLGSSAHYEQDQYDQHDQQQHQQQQRHPGRHDEELWQSVSPPSFSSSPGLLISAAAARAAAAAASTQQPGPASASAAAAAAAAAEQEERAAGPHQQDMMGDDDDDGAMVDDDDVGHGRFYGVTEGLSISPETEAALQAAVLHAQHSGAPQHLQPHHMAHSSYVLRQSELVDLSLSTSMHPSQLQHAQQAHQQPGWLTAHQQLPPAAAQAVERAAVALNDSYCFQGRASPSEFLGAAGGGVGGGTAGGSRGIGGAVAIRRSGAVQQWNRAQTQPQQDQRARHRLPSPAAHNGPMGPFGWPGAAVLGDWFSSTVQQPLAAAASRAAVGVGQRLGMAPGQGQQQQQQQQQPSNTSSSSRQAAVVGIGAPGGSTTSGARGIGGVGGAASHAGPAGPAVCGSSNHNSSGGGGAEEGLEDAVLVEKTSDLPQSLQEQEDEAFRGLLFLGGRDSQGRPVVIVNTDAIPAGHNSAPRDAALAYLLKRLTPIVTRGPYVLVVVALHNGPQFRLLPGVWCVRAYQSLPRAFRKHVKHVILLQPSMLVKTAVTLLYPFVSSKAHAKVKQVQRLLDIDAATCGEVQVPHLGEAFLTTLHHINSSRARAPDATTQD